MIEAVGFDLDYTLAVPERDRGTLLAEATDRVDAPEVTREAYLEAHGANLATETRTPIFEAVLPGDAEVSAGALACAYREAVEDALVPVPGAADLVADLRERYRVGLLTDGPTRAQRGKLEALGWTGLFDAVVVTGPLPAGKPDPRTFGALVDALDVAAGRIAYVGDLPTADVRGAADAGLRAIQVVYEGGPEPDPAAEAVLERDRLAGELPGLLAGL